MNVCYWNELRHLISSNNNILIYLVPIDTDDIEFSETNNSIILHKMKAPWDNHSFFFQWTQW
jgi:hypothetical protein